MRGGIMAVGVLFCAAAVQAGPHPHYFDGGAVNWKASWQAALLAARASGKPIFIDAGIEN
jgi:hypothetical protein